MKREILGLALAGGSSRRFGEDKALVSFHEGTTQLDYTVKLLHTFCSRVAVSIRNSSQADRELHQTADMILDAKGIQGPMAGVISSLRHTATHPVLVVACDMPLVDGSVILRLLSNRNPDRVASCFLGADDRPEPLCAIYERKALPLLEAYAKEENFSLRHFLEGEEVERLSFSKPQLLASVNTMKEFENIRKRFAL